ncbi:MAG: hypothetical protein WCF33_12490 [Pseudonocardiaceae bacterium]
MSTENGHRTPGPAAVTRVWPAVLLRYRSGTIGHTARVVHLVPLVPGSQAASAVVAFCGALLRRDFVEAVRSGQGTLCALGVINHCNTSSPPPADTLAAVLPGGVISHETDPQRAAGCYRAWGWPVRLRGNQVWLNLEPDTVTLTIPVSLAVQATKILHRWRCRSLALIHPDAPEHRVVLAGQRHSVAPPYPRSVHRTTGTLPLPPTVTPCGPLTWVRPTPSERAFSMRGIRGIRGTAHRRATRPTRLKSSSPHSGSETTCSPGMSLYRSLGSVRSEQLSLRVRS